MSYYVYGKTADGTEFFVRTCDTFEDAVEEISYLYDVDDRYGGIPTYYFMVEKEK